MPQVPALTAGSIIVQRAPSGLYFGVLPPAGTAAPGTLLFIVAATAMAARE